MPDLILRQYDKSEFQALVRASEQGDEDAVRELAAISKEGAGSACFLCNASVGTNPFNQVIPEHGSADKVLVAPLCTHCGSLPKMVRLHRIIKLLKAMYSSRSGKRITFQLTPSRVPQERRMRR